MLVEQQPYQQISFKNLILRHLARNILARNKVFKNIHQGESCYIFGNGISLKGMDLKKFDDKISIGCGFIYLHKEFPYLNMRYCLELHPFYYYPLWKNPYSRLREKNILGALSKKFLTDHKNLISFCSLSNYFGIRAENIYYLHNFGLKTPSLEACNLDGNFSFMQGALYGMIGLAIYMGFKKATLVGCDYTHSPARSLHFYEKGEGVIHTDTNRSNNVFFELIKQKIDLLTVTIPGTQSKDLKYVEYDKYSGEKFCYRENTQIVEKKWLNCLRDSKMYSVC